MSMPLNPDFFERFLKLLGISGRKPGIAALTELVTACMMRIPFENVSKLYYKKHFGMTGIPDPELYLDGIARFNFGGTCYSNNYYLYLLLEHLGYDVMLCGADMNDPDVHIVTMLSLNGREFLVDAGYASPFIEPLPRDLKEDYVISLGRDRYVLKPQDKNGNSTMELYKDGRHRHGYVAKPIPRPIEYFGDAIADSYQDYSTFMNNLLLARHHPKRSLVIRNLSIIESEGRNCHIRHIGDRNELPAAVEKYFSIPAEFTSEAVAELGEFGDPWT